MTTAADHLLDTAAENIADQVRQWLHEAALERHGYHPEYSGGVSARQIDDMIDAALYDADGDGETRHAAELVIEREAPQWERELDLPRPGQGAWLRDVVAFWIDAAQSRRARRDERERRILGRTVAT